VDIEVPRDRQGTFEPQLVKKGQTRLEGFDEKILALYARGMTTREIQAQLQELYGVEVSATLISNVSSIWNWRLEKWDALSPSISKSWRAHWTRVIPLFAFSEDIRKVIYTTNATPSVNRTLRKVTRHHRIFPSDEAVYKVVYLAMRTMAVTRGPCPSITGNRHSIALRWNSPSASHMTKNYLHNPLDRLCMAISAIQCHTV
jgi:transposase-like protein